MRSGKNLTAPKDAHAKMGEASAAAGKVIESERSRREQAGADDGEGEPEAGVERGARRLARPAA